MPSSTRKTSAGPRIQVGEHAVALAGADRDGDPALGGDPPVGEQRAEVRDRARPHVDDERRGEHPGQLHERKATGSCTRRGPRNAQQRPAISRARRRSSWLSTSTQSTSPIGATVDDRRRGRPAPGSRPRSTARDRGARSPRARRPAAPRRPASISVAPMYSPCASAGSISLVILGRRPSGPSDDLHLLVGERLDVVHGEHDAGLRRPRASSVCSTATGCTVSPLTSSAPCGEVLAGQPQRVGVVPLLGLVVVHQGQPDAVLGLQRGRPVPTALGRVADHDGDVAQPDRGEVAQGDVEDRDRRRRPAAAPWAARRCRAAAAARRRRRGPCRSTLPPSAGREPAAEEIPAE